MRVFHIIFTQNCFLPSSAAIASSFLSQTFPILSLISTSLKIPNSYPFPSNFLKTLKPPICSTLNRFLSSPHQIRSTIAPKSGSKRKGKESMRGESPLHYDHSSYLSREAFNRYSIRNITFGRVVNFSHLDFMGFNQ